MQIGLGCTTSWYVVVVVGRQKSQGEEGPWLSKQVFVSIFFPPFFFCLIFPNVCHTYIYTYICIYIYIFFFQRGNSGNVTGCKKHGTASFFFSSFTFFLAIIWKYKNKTKNLENRIGKTCFDKHNGSRPTDLVLPIKPRIESQTCQSR